MIFLHISQILREINFGDYRSAKSTILKHLKPLIFEFYESLHFLKSENNQINQIQSPKTGKKGPF